MLFEIHVASKENECLLKDDGKAFDKWIENLSSIGISVNLVQHSNNKLGLGELYNNVLREIRETKRSLDYLVFLHSDVKFNLEHLFLKVVSLKGKYDLIGLAGAKKIDLKQSPLSWFTASKDSSDKRYGKVSQKFNGNVWESFFNLSNPEVEDTFVAAIDGLCMILAKTMIEDPEIIFDERFKYDFYDLDFCLNSMVRHKKKLGVIIEPCYHESVGESILKPEFLEVEKIFKEKWKVEKPNNGH